MGGERKPSDTRKLPYGVEIRYWESGRTTLRIIFQHRGVRCRETLKLEATSQNIKYAERLRSEILNAIERGAFDFSKYFPNSKRAKLFGNVSSNITIRTLLQEFLSQAEKSLEFSTYEGYRKLCDAHLIPIFGNLPIRELTPAILRNWIKTLNIKAKTIRNILTPLRAIVEQAITDEIISTNPLDKIILSKLIDKKVIKSDFKVDPFDKKEVQDILGVDYAEQAKNIFQFAFFSGLRTSELIGLKWKDVDWINNIIHVTRAVVRKRTKGTKTKAGTRKIMLLPPAYDALMKQKKYTFSQGEYVFHNPSTNQPWATDGQIRKTAWTPLLKKAGVRYRNPYQTRHTYASTMLSQGENIMWVAHQMGHADIEMVMRTYGKWIPDRTVLAGYRPLNQWADYLTEI